MGGWLSQNGDSDESTTLEVYSLFCKILKKIDLLSFSEMEMADRFKNDLLKRFFSPLGQQNLAVAWAQLCCQGAASDPFDRSYANYFKAMWYDAKALDIIEAHDLEIDLGEIHRQASGLFFPFIQTCLSSFIDKLDQAKRKADYETFGSLIKSLDHLRQYCCQESDGVWIEDLFRGARGIWNTIRDLEQQRKLGQTHACLFQLEMKEIPPPHQFATYRYRQELKNFRNSFKIAFRAVCEKRFGQDRILAISLVRGFQEEMAKTWVDFFKRTFLEDAFAILGPPPCDYTLEVMGSYTREEFTPYSDLEWFIVVAGQKEEEEWVIVVAGQKEEERTYFERLARLIELQIASLGESEGKESEVHFSCLPLKVGFSLDKDGNPAQSDLIFTSPFKPLLSLAEERFEELILNTSLAYSRTLDSKNLQKDNFLFHEENAILRKAQAIKLLKIRLADYEKICNEFRGNLLNLNLKKNFLEPLTHFLRDLSLYFGIEAYNTIDIVTRLVRHEIFTQESGDLLQQCLADLYLIRLQQQFDSDDTSFLLEENLVSCLEKTYWLVLRPLYCVLNRCLHPKSRLETHFQHLDLYKSAFFEEKLNPDRIEDFKPLIVHLVHHLVAKNLVLPFEEEEEHFALHEPYYQYLSSMTATDPLREVYLKTLALICRTLAHRQTYQFFC